MPDASTDLRTASPTASAQPELRLASLFNGAPALAALSLAEIRREAWLDAYLLSAGLTQLIDDHLQPDRLQLRRIAAFVAGDGRSRPRAAAARVMRGGANVLDRRPGVRNRRLTRLREPLERGVEQLAALVAASGEADPSGLEEMRHTLATIDAHPSLLPRALRRDIVRFPACFRSFDQHPADLARIVARFSSAHRGRPGPLLVVGVRTSGSYLAPLCAAYLRAAGQAEVTVTTMRPGRRPTSSQRGVIRALARRGARVLVLDDPPGTGGSVAAVAEMLEALGVPRSQIVLLLPLFAGVSDPPPALAGYECVVLPFEQWSIHDRLHPGAVLDAANRLLGGERRALAAQALRTDLPAGGRGHIRRVVRLTRADGSSEDLAVEGVGLGYFGAHALAVAEPLRDFLPAILGVADGLLIRAWMPEGARAELAPRDDRRAVASRVADYVLARGRSLALDTDVTLRQRGQNPAWEAASTVLCRPFGRGWPVVRALAMNRLVKRLMRVERPSLIDGRAELSRWFVPGEAARALKVEWDQGSSSSRGVRCCDPLFDLAAAASWTTDAAFEEELRRAYEAGGGTIAEEPWLLYQLAALTAGEHARDAEPSFVQRACARAMQRYYGRVYFGDLDPDPAGPLCGIDIDGVLETEHLGFPALTPTSAGALRALTAHGYRPLLVTGRSLADVIDRCRAYRLSGAVAEYGSAVYDARDGRVDTLAPDAERAALERLRVALASTAGVALDGDYRHAIRAYAIDGRGRRRALADPSAAQAQQVADAESVRTIVGDRQTDFVAASIHKGVGAAALSATLRSGARAGGPPLAFAVGDTASDVPLLELAQRPFVPAHADRALRARASMTRAPYQRGFAEAVGALIGHRPGACGRCRLSRPTPQRRRVLRVLSVHEHGIGLLPWQLARLGALR